MTIDADVESDDNAVLQIIDYDISMTALPFLPQTPFQLPTPGPCMESNPTQPLIMPQKCKAADLDLEDSQDLGKKWLQASPLGPFSLTGTALQSATNILNGEIETPKSSHAVHQCLKDLETEVVRRISSKDYTTFNSEKKQKQFSHWWKETCDAVPGLMLLGGKHCHWCRRMKTGKLRVPHARTTCSDGFLSIHKEVPYPLPSGLVIKDSGCGTPGDLVPEEFSTVAT
ncbi:uncharacterized protein EI90DRAFT_3022472 [Cantharellus anzutake]|uniref:uncharacterized protein n=1 Tax=Cantharellus anzutake TaxID=1750568 RepID=UPI001908FC3F|nr:uncharacterized protein EI90DRAFT_3022472 [Cantharellus anzutake]KAF8314127.1 hypothetical protein EI90DRAFT_3022472 [Cantharellus anzutake]